MDVTLSPDDFKELSKDIREVMQKLNWYETHGIEWVKAGLKFLLFFGGWLIFALPHLAFQILGITIMSYAFTSIGISGIHEASHQSMAKSRRWNLFAAYFFTEFWVSKSHDWWRWRHVETHHPHTNVINKEPMLFYVPWFHKYVYFFLMPYVVVPWIIASSIWHLRKNPIELLIYLSISTLGYLSQASLFLILGYSWGISLLLVFVMRSIFAPLFLHIAVFNHIGLPYFDAEPRPEWMTLQSKTTRNIKPNWFLKILGGNAFLDGHIEHHLFPHLSNHAISKVREKIVTFLKKRGYEYREEGYVSCLRQCLKHYHLIFDELRHPLW
ncbi:MAG: fatty acid desaturase [Candidatus Altimarinota bacterium]